MPSTSREKAAKMVKWFGAFQNSQNSLQDPFTIEFPSADRVDCRIASHSSLAAVFDDIGRIAVIDCERERLLFRNDGT